MGCPQGREGSTPSGASLFDGPVAERQTHHCSTAFATRTVPRSGRGLAWSGRLPRTQENAGSNPAAPTEKGLSHPAATAVHEGVAGEREGKPTGDGTRLLAGRGRKALEGSTPSPSAARCACGRAAEAPPRQG